MAGSQTVRSDTVSVYPKWSDKEGTPHELCLQQYDHYISNCECRRPQTVRSQQISLRWSFRDLILFFFCLCYAIPSEDILTHCSRMSISFLKCEFHCHFVRAPPSGVSRENIIVLLLLYCGCWDLLYQRECNCLFPHSSQFSSPPKSIFLLGSLANWSKSRIYEKGIR